MKNFNSFFNSLVAMPKRLAMVLTMIFFVGVVQVFADYTIEFKSNTKNEDGSTAQTSIENLISSGGDNVSTISAVKAYNGKSGYGVKLGASRELGYVTMELVSAAQIKASKLVVSAAYFDSGKTLKVTITYTDNTTTTETLTPASTITAYDVELTATKTIKTIKIESVTKNNGRIYCASIKVVAAAATTYTVTYNANGATSGTVPNDATQYNSGATVIVKTNSGSLARTGYTFGGWNTNSSGTGTNYAAGSGTFRITGNTTLYAKWTAKQTNISINANTENHGSGSGFIVVVTYGQALPSFTACTPATGYELAGYYTSATGGTKVIGKDGKLVASVSGYTDANAKWINESASLTLYAQYSAKNYTVTYAGNSGTTSCAGGTYTYNSSFDICSDEPTRTGYTFTGWSDGTNTYQSGANYTMPAKNVTFTAQWQINTYKVKWKVDGSETEEDVNYNSKPTKAPTIDPANLPCDGADKFMGWTTSEYTGNTAPGTLYPTAADIPAITDDITFYAVFADYAD